MRVIINGEPKGVTDSTTVAELLEMLGVSGRFAVEVNEEIVPRSQYSCQTLQPADKIEIVKAIGGG